MSRYTCRGSSGLPDCRTRFPPKLGSEEGTHTERIGERVGSQDLGIGIGNVGRIVGRFDDFGCGIAIQAL